MAFIIHDEELAAEALALFERRWPEWNYEVSEGDVVVSPLATNDHEDLRDAIVAALGAVIDPAAGDRAMGPRNVSDRAAGWGRNYRNPDASVYLCSNPAVNHGTHWQGGPDLAVEVLSPGERPAEKFPFYAHVGTREVLLVYRDPWRLELWRPAGGALQLAASAVPGGAPAASAVLPVLFGLRPAVTRPEVTLTHAATGQVWTA